MPIDTKLPEGLDEFDVIVAGGGSAGCVVAGRLAAADANLRVLLIEGGENNYGVKSVVNPALFRENLAPTSRNAVIYKGRKSAAIGDREAVVHTGGILGGGSSINIMLYTRGLRSDYDSWNTPGWSTDELMPCFQKIETYHGHGPKEVHGYSGPVQITRGPFQVLKTEDDFIEACEKRGIPERVDMQDFQSSNGTERWHGTISSDGRRQDAAHAYIHPLLKSGQRPNLHVLCQSKVVRVLFDDSKRACGVEYIPNPAYDESTAASPTPRTVRATKQVVVSSGALGTPPILERSGIGNKSILTKAGVTPLVDLPGVGHDYQDHNLIWYFYRTNLSPTETQDAFITGRGDPSRADALASHATLLGWNGCDVSAKVRPTTPQLSSLSQTFQNLWARDFVSRPDRPLVQLTLHSALAADPSTTEPGQYISIGTYTLYPYSRGHVHIMGAKWGDELDFDPGFFAGENGDVDVEAHVWAYKVQREIMRRTRMFEGELAMGHPKFAEGSAAQLTTRQQAGDVQDLTYDEEDDEAIRKFVRENVATTWHSLGTAKMAPREETGVVDPELSVWGVQGLKVADLSVVPGNVGGNTNNTALMVGEKCAVLMLKELGLTEGEIPARSE